MSVIGKFKIVIDQDGSRTVFDPNTEDGKTQIKDSGESGFVELKGKELKDHPNNTEFKFRDGKTLHLATNPDGTLVSKTSLQDTKLDKTDPNRYFDTDSKPMVALTDQMMTKLGLTVSDLGREIKITNIDNNQTVTAIFADAAGANKKPDHLEVNPVAAEALGVKVITSTGATKGNDIANFTIEAPLPTPQKASSSAPTKGAAKTGTHG